MTTRWFDDDAFWDAIAPILFDDARVEAARQEVEQALALLDVQPGAPLLDLCCGVGRHSLELARRGFSVIGVDRTDRYLDRARSAAIAQDLTVEFVRADMSEFRRPGAFDGALNMFTAFGYFETDEEELQVLTNVFESLKPNGRLIIDVMGKEVLARRFQPRSWQSTADRTAFLLEERTIRNGWGAIDNCWTVFDDAGRHEFRFPLRVYSGKELELLLHRAGFFQVALYGSLAAAKYDHEAERLVAVARK